MTREDAAEVAAAECFWGDYDLNAQSILERIALGDEDLKLLVFSKIVDNASYPSRLLRALFAPSELEQLLAQTEYQPRWRKERYRLVRANLTGDHSLVPERQWQR